MTASPETPPEPALLAGLAAIAAEIAPGGAGARDLRRLSGGASQETWAFFVDTPGGALPMILRRQAKGYQQRPDQPGLEVEARLMAAAGRAGIPSPPVRLILAPGHGLGRGFVMDRVEGETIARKLLRDPEYAEIRPRLPRRIGEIMAAIHALPAGGLPPLRTAGAAGRLGEILQRYRAIGARRPIFELAILWLEDNLPSPVPARLVHGDLRNGNMIIDSTGVRAVLDWELAHFGDPMEDLGWMCVGSWRFGQIDRPVGGFGPRGEMFAGYHAAGGAAVDPARVRWWEVLGSFSWGVSCAAMAVPDPGRDRPLERVMTGLRASECEIDLLRLLTGEA
jgi:aminoglycoside phosphotransferase (APT) family kinase protein